MPVLSPSKPYAVRLSDRDPSPGFLRYQELNNVSVGGTPVSFDLESKTVGLGGDSWSVEDWMELRRRIDLLFIRAGVLETTAPPSSPQEGRSSGFIGNNIEELATREMGYLKPAPWLLRLLYSGVVTKDRYR